VRYLNPLPEISETSEIEYRPALYIRAATNLLGAEFDIMAVKALLLKKAWVFKPYTHAVHKIRLAGQGNKYVIHRLKIDNIKTMKDDEDAITIYEAMRKLNALKDITFSLSIDHRPPVHQALPPSTVKTSSVSTDIRRDDTTATLNIGLFQPNDPLFTDQYGGREGISYAASPFKESGSVPLRTNIPQTQSDLSLLFTAPLRVTSPLSDPQPIYVPVLPDSVYAPSLNRVESFRDSSKTRKRVPYPPKKPTDSLLPLANVAATRPTRSLTQITDNVWVSSPSEPPLIALNKSVSVSTPTTAKAWNGLSIPEVEEWRDSLSTIANLYEISEDDLTVSFSLRDFLEISDDDPENVSCKRVTIETNSIDGFINLYKRINNLKGQNELLDVQELDDLAQMDDIDNHTGDAYIYNEIYIDD
jgi:hypothetical protein